MTACVVMRSVMTTANRLEFVSSGLVTGTLGKDNHIGILKCSFAIEHSRLYKYDKVSMLFSVHRTFSVQFVTRTFSRNKILTVL